MKVQHKTNETGQLQPLKQRLSLARQQARQEKRDYRSNIAQAIGRTNAVALAAYSVTSRGFFQRFKWLLFGH